MEFWLQLLQTLGGVGIAAAALVWLTKSIVAQWLSKDVETYKATLASNLEAYKTLLSSESMRQIEAFKADLQQIATEKNVRFTKLHEKRIEVIAELYYLIENALLTLQLFHRVLKGRATGKFSEKNDVKWEQEARELTDSLFEFIQRNKLYFGTELSKTLEEVMLLSSSPMSDYAVHKIRVRNGDQEDVSGALGIVEKWSERLKTLSAAKELIERQFREMLGSFDA